MWRLVYNQSKKHETSTFKVDVVHDRELTYFQIAIVKHNFESGLGNSEFDCLNKTIELKNNKYLRLDLQIPNYLLL